MFFCPNCSNSLSITQQDQTEQSNTQNVSETPVTVSSSSNEPSKEVSKIQNKVSSLSNKAYFKCSNCGYAQEIEPGTQILSRAPEKSTSDHIIDPSKYKNMIYDEAVPHTRNYICPNKSCKSHTDHSVREAIWFKPNRYSYTIINVCKACQTAW